jgi:Fe-S-cluster-containing hydrogenase component 2
MREVRKVLPEESARTAVNIRIRQKGETMEKAHKKIIVISEKCAKDHPCGAVKLCPAGALTQEGLSAPSADIERCTGCGKCAKYCPRGALVLE